MTATIALTTENRTLHFSFALPRLRLWQPMCRVREPNPPRASRRDAPLVLRPLWPDTAIGGPWPPVI